MSRTLSVAAVAMLFLFAAVPFSFMLMNASMAFANIAGLLILLACGMLSVRTIVRLITKERLWGERPPSSSD